MNHCKSWANKNILCFETSGLPSKWIENESEIQSCDPDVEVNNDTVYRE